MFLLNPIKEKYMVYNGGANFEHKKVKTLKTNDTMLY